ncbi:hypothetical protein ACTHO0_17350 [Cytobacillus praedii]|nr:hypothetical protein [Cytobacillus praedii]
MFGIWLVTSKGADQLVTKHHPHIFSLPNKKLTLFLGSVQS